MPNCDCRASVRFLNVYVNYRSEQACLLIGKYDSGRVRAFTAQCIVAGTTLGVFEVGNEALEYAQVPMVHTLVRSECIGMARRAGGGGSVSVRRTDNPGFRQVSAGRGLCESVGEPPGAPE